MLTCITCSKQRTEDGGEDTPRGTPSTKDAVKSLTTQIKDMALKVSGASNKGKPPDGNFKKGQRGYPEFDTTSEGGSSFPYMQQPGSSSSTPAWDFRTAGHRADSRFTTFGGDRTPRAGEMVLQDKDEAKEWMAQVEPGVQITFVSLPRGGNDLKRIRFSREIFDKWQAQKWWGENFDRIMELYNVQKFNQQALNSTPGRSEDGRDSSYSRLGSAIGSPRMTPSVNREWSPMRNRPGGDSFSGSNQNYNGGSNAYPSMEASTSSRDEASVSISNASEVDSEWIEEDEPGVYITIRQLADGTRELRRVRFSREKFGEAHAKLWWETNRDRIQVQYLC